MNKKIGIIGAGGKMGNMFANYFIKMGFEVIGYDESNEIKVKSITKANSLIGAVLQNDYVFLCIPIKKTPEIVRLVSKEMKRDSFLIDISSQKDKTATALGKMPKKINPICMHPMFGPCLLYTSDAADE